jgi:hypothetical protein
MKAAAGRRWRLFPVEAEGKQPLVKEWQTIPPAIWHSLTRGQSNGRPATGA